MAAGWLFEVLPHLIQSAAPAPVRSFVSVVGRDARVKVNSAARGLAPALTSMMSSALWNATRVLGSAGSLNMWPPGKERSGLEISITVATYIYKCRMRVND